MEWESRQEWGLYNMDGNVTYNAVSLQTYNPTTRVGIIVRSIKHTDAPDASGDAIAIANASDSNVPTFEHTNKVITIEGVIAGSTQADLDNRIDAFKGYFNRRNKNLDIVYSTGARRYTVMKSNGISINRQNKVIWADFTVVLFCKPFGIDTTPTVIANSVGVTGASHTYTPTISGSAPYQLPVFTITVTAKTGSGDYIQVSNDLNGQQTIVTGLGLVAGDVVVFDSVKRRVTRNGVVVDYGGTFLEFEPGPVSFTITDGFATRTKTVLGEIYRRWL